MSTVDIHNLVDALILLIVAASGAVTAYTHWKVSQLPTTKETAAVASKLAETIKENGKGEPQAGHGPRPAQ